MNLHIFFDADYVLKWVFTKITISGSQTEMQVGTNMAEPKAEPFFRFGVNDMHVPFLKIKKKKKLANFWVKWREEPL